MFLSAQEVIERADGEGLRRALVLCALPIELAASQLHLKPWGTVPSGSYIFECAEFVGTTERWLVVLCETSMGTHAAQGHASAAHVAFGQFEFALFVGIAASRKADAPVGSVIAGSKIYAPYGEKHLPEGFKSRPDVFPCDMKMASLARLVARAKEWPSRLRWGVEGVEQSTVGYPMPFPPIALVAPIVSVEAVSADPDSALEAIISERYQDALGLEMEGYGGAYSSWAERTPFMAIRGVSDMRGDKTLELDAVRQPVAAMHAAAFAFEFIDTYAQAEAVSGSRRSALNSPRAPTVNSDELAAPIRDASGQDSTTRLSLREDRITVGDESAPKTRLLQASRALLSWKKSLSDGSVLDRPEIDQLLRRVQDENCSVTVLLGPAGSGKSAALARLTECLVNRSTTVVALKADLLSADTNSEARLAEQLDLPDHLSRIVRSIAQLETVVVVIDQLDALAGYVDLRTDRLNLVLNLVRKLAGIERVHIVLSARTFEYHHDTRLKTVNAEEITLSLPPWSDIQPILERNGFDPLIWPPDAREMLRNPQALDVLLSLGKGKEGDEVSTYAALLERLWNEKVIQGPKADRKASLASEMAVAMSDEETFWLARARFDDRAADIRALVSDGILTTDDRNARVSFSHQTVHDFVLARAFVREAGSLSRYVGPRMDSLFVRPKIWTALSYFRGTESFTYEREFSAIWQDERLRSHVWMLLIEFLGSQSEPSAFEQARMAEALHSEQRNAAIAAMAGSVGWFDWFSGNGLQTSMSGTEAERSQVTGLLWHAVRHRQEEVLRLLRRHWMDEENQRRSVVHVLQNAIDWQGAIVDLVAELLKRDEYPEHNVDYLLQRVYDYSQESAARLVMVHLDAVLARARDEKRRLLAERQVLGEQAAKSTSLYQIERTFDKLLDIGGQYETVERLAEERPDLMALPLWEWVTQVCKHSIKPDKFENLLEYPGSNRINIRLAADNVIEIGGFGGENVMLINLLKALEALATSDRQEFVRLLAPGQDRAFAQLQLVLTIVLARKPDSYAEEALRFLCADVRRLMQNRAYGSYEPASHLVAASQKFWSDEELAEFIEHINEVKDPTPNLTDTTQRRYIRDELRRMRFHVLSAIPTERRSEKLERQLREEERVPKNRIVPVTSTGVQFIGSPMSSEAMMKASDAEIIAAFRAIPDATDWSHPTRAMEGGNIQLSRALGEMAVQEPQRALTLLSGFEPEFGTRAAGQILESVAEHVESSVLVENIKRLSERGFVGTEFRSSAASALYKIKDNNWAPDDDLYSLLREWLTSVLNTETERREAAEEIEPSPSDADGKEGSIMFQGSHFRVISSRTNSILSVLSLGLLRQNRPNELLDLWIELIDSIMDSNEWAHKIHLAQYLQKADEDKLREFSFKLLENFPDLKNTADLGFMLASLRWNFPAVVNEILSLWDDALEDRTRQLYGELVSVFALTASTQAGMTERLTKILESGCEAERVGAAYGAVQLWEDEKVRGRSVYVLERLNVGGSQRIWNAFVDVFRMSGTIDGSEEWKRLLEIVDQNVLKPRVISTAFIADSLQTAPPHHSQLIASIALKLVAKSYQRAR
jgi:nucleoside phosphorylase